MVQPLWWDGLAQKKGLCGEGGVEFFIRAGARSRKCHKGHTCRLEQWHLGPLATSSSLGHDQKACLDILGNLLSKRAHLQG